MSLMNIQEPNYQSFVSEIKQKIRSAQYNALKAVNTELIQLYWNIGKAIVEKQGQFGWGKSIVENLSKDLQQEFPNENGFSVTNLWNMRQFFSEYKEKQFLQPLVGEIGWSHNVVIMQKCKTDSERQYYLTSTKRFGWSKNVLIHQIEAKSFERHILNQTNFEQTLSEKYKEQAILAIKDHYIFDFLGLADEYSERELEEALIKNIRNFLIEMGGSFSFIGNQFQIKVSDKTYSIDLLLFHRKLKSLIAIDLKIGEFLPEYKGKMEFYLNVLNDKYKEEGENDAIGIIICKSKDRTIVEYSLRNSNMPIGIATYNTSSVLPEIYKNFLPSPEEFAEKLEFIEDITNKDS